MAEVPDGIIQFSKRLVRLEQIEDQVREGSVGIRLVFEDQTETIADLVIGADGIHSVRASPHLYKTGMN